MINPFAKFWLIITDHSFAQAWPSATIRLPFGLCIFSDSAACMFGMQAAESEKMHKPKGRRIVAEGQAWAKE
jgi:hypothetical protein